MAESKAFSVGAIFIGSLITIVSIIGLIIGDDIYIYYDAPIYGVCIVGVFMGIILVLAGIYDYFKADEREKQDIQPKKQDRYCPKCGRSIPLDARVCPFCKKDFEED